MISGRIHQSQPISSFLVRRENFAENLKANSFKMVAMSKQLLFAVLVNLALGLLFIFGNAYVWMIVNRRIVFSNWLWIQATPPNNMLGFEIIPNVPFVVFWLSAVVNLYFLIKIGRSKET